MTNREFFEMAMTLTDDADFIEKAQAQLDILNRKAASKKPTANQVENATVIQPAIVELLGDGKSYTVTEIAGVVGYSNQRISANCKALVEAGAVVRVYDKKVARFSLA